MAFTNGAWPPFVYTHDVTLANGGPYRAGANDLGGYDFADKDPAPEIGSEPTASVTNEQNRHIAGLERVTELAKLWVRFLAGSPTVLYVVAMGTLVTVSNFTVTHVSTGVVDILWLQGTLAPQAADPECSPLAAGVLPWGELHPSPPSGHNGIRVSIQNPSTLAAADGDFTVAIY